MILPDQGENAIYNFVNSATSSIDVTMYELKDTTVVNDLVASEKAGRQRPGDPGPGAEVLRHRRLQRADGGRGRRGLVLDPFTYTHQKTITVDDDESYISTGNFDTKYYATSRDYGVFDTDANDVAAIVAVFNADYAHTSITPSDGDDLVWSPTDSQTRLLALINGATKSLDIEQEEFSDTALVNAIVAASKRGVTVRVVLERPVLLLLGGQRGQGGRRQGDRLLRPRPASTSTPRRSSPTTARARQGRSRARRTSQATRSTTTASSA